MLAAVTIALPLSATIADASAAGAKLPPELAKYRSPLPEARTKQVIQSAVGNYGPGKPLLRAKAGVTAAQRRAAIIGIDNFAKLAKSDPKASVLVKDSVKLWEAMTSAQKNELIASSDGVVGFLPAAVAAAGGVEVVVATAAVVVAAVEVAGFVYEVYQDQRDHAADAPAADAPAADAPAEDAEGEDDDDLDDEDADAIRDVLSY